MIRVPVPAFMVRWLVTAVALVATVYLVPNINIDDSGGLIAVLVMAAVLGLANAIIRPVLVLLSCGLVAASMGLFLLIINGFTLWFSAWVSEHWFEVGFRIDGFVPAIIGAIIVSVISFLLNLFVTAEDQE